MPEKQQVLPKSSLVLFRNDKTPTLNGRGLLSAETRGFEPPKGLTPYLISSEAHSTGLCDVSSCLCRLSVFLEFCDISPLMPLTTGWAVVELDRQPASGSPDSGDGVLIFRCHQVSHDAKCNSHQSARTHSNRSGLWQQTRNSEDASESSSD